MGPGDRTTSVERSIADQLSLGTEREAEASDFETLKRHPLYFGVTRPLGTHTKTLTDELEAVLEKAGYFVQPIRLSELIARTYFDLTGNELAPTSVGDRRSRNENRNMHAYRGLMRAGDFLRVINPAMVGRLAVLEINSKRAEHIQNMTFAGKNGIAYVITHFMHPEEVHTLRSVYGQRFFLVAANASKRARQRYIVSELSRQDKSGDRRFKVDTSVDASGDESPLESSDAEALGKELIAIDAGITTSMKMLSARTRLNVDETFHLADLFVRSRAESRKLTKVDRETDARVKSEVYRFLAQILSFPFGSPTTQETAMASAYLAAKSSVALGRSVGAALVDNNGSVVSTGWNEVAKPQGGPYRENDQPDHRDHVNGFDPSDVSRIDAIKSFLDVVLVPSLWKDYLESGDGVSPETRAWLESLRDAIPQDGLSPSFDVVAGFSALEPFDRTRIMHLIEFGRSVHAEMAALSDAYRRGVGANGVSMYVTTFPCHECTRNLISFGIRSVLYVEPYGKSMAASLYRDEVNLFSEPGETDAGKVEFLPFSGVSPRVIDSLFSPVRRKYGLRDQVDRSRVGNAVEWSVSSSLLRPVFVDYPPGYSSTPVNSELESSRLGVELVVAATVASEIRKARMKVRNPDK